MPIIHGGVSCCKASPGSAMGLLAALPGLRVHRTLTQMWQARQRSSAQNKSRRTLVFLDCPRNCSRRSSREVASRAGQILPQGKYVAKQQCSISIRNSINWYQKIVLDARLSRHSRQPFSWQDWHFEHWKCTNRGWHRTLSTSCSRFRGRSRTWRNGTASFVAGATF